MKYKVKIKKNNTLPTYRVYFDNDTGNISSITNREVSHLKNSFIVPIQEVEEFLLGSRNMTKHRVVFNVKEQRYQIVSNNESIVVYADDLIFRLSPNQNAQIIVHQCLKENKWKIFASEETKKSMKSVESRLEEVLFFSITEYGNPNILYNHYYVQIKDLLEQDSIDFGFTSQEEQDPLLVSVYTNRKFNKYSHEVVND